VSLLARLKGVPFYKAFWSGFFIKLILRCKQIYGSAEATPFQNRDFIINEGLSLI
jgi:hypothetical protein